MATQKSGLERGCLLLKDWWMKNNGELGSWHFLGFEINATATFSEITLLLARLIFVFARSLRLYANTPCSETHIALQIGHACAAARRYSAHSSTLHRKGVSVCQCGIAKLQMNSLERLNAISKAQVLTRNTAIS
jgi:hypothetical protein